jgi:mercuric ion transport protein
MNSPERLPTETHKPFTGYLWGAGRAHLSLPFADSRRCAGRHDGRRVHRRALGIAALTLTGLFVLSVTRRCGPSGKDHERFPPD